MSSLQIIVIDDEPAIRQILAASLSKAGHAVDVAGSGHEALKRLIKGDVDVAVCDLNMPDLTGIEVIRQARAAGVETTFIMMTAYSSVDTAIEAMKAGAVDYMIKPLRTAELTQRLIQIGELRGLKRENDALRKLVVGSGDELCGTSSAAMRVVDRLVAKVAPIDSTVLITGESGTGKGVVARRIHQQSHRAAQPFIPVNCGAIPENLLESELFGHKKGSFTGAVADKVGKVEAANGGSLFLDEIGEMPMNLQVKLLRVLQERVIERVGDLEPRPVDIRVVAATKKSLRELVRPYILRRLNHLVDAAHRKGLALPSSRSLRGVESIRVWDGLVVGPFFGFRDAEDYYTRASVAPLLAGITLPALVIHSRADPMVPFATVRAALDRLSPTTVPRVTDRGGHVGFPADLDLGLGPTPGLRGQVLDWLTS